MQEQTTVNPLVEINEKLKIQHLQKRDFVVPSSKLSYHDNHLFIKGKGITDISEFQVSDLCHDQIASKLDIPTKYYNRMRAEKPALLEENINGWLSNPKGKPYLVRCLEMPDKNIARAFLSDSFNMLDNYDILFCTLEVIAQMGVNIEIRKAEITEKRLYIQCVCPEIEVQAEEFLKNYKKEKDATVGNGIIAGFQIANSETGHGAYTVGNYSQILKCRNGLTGGHSSDALRRVHIGNKMDEGVVQWSEETKQKNYQLGLSQTKDTIKTFLSPEYLGNLISRVAVTKNISLKNPYDCVKNVCQNLGITQEHRDKVLANFITNADMKASGILQAVTEESQNMQADLQYDVEMNILDAVTKDILKFDKKFSKN